MTSGWLAFLIRRLPIPLKQGLRCYFFLACSLSVATILVSVFSGDVVLIVQSDLKRAQMYRYQSLWQHDFNFNQTGYRHVMEDLTSEWLGSADGTSISHLFDGSQTVGLSSTIENVTMHDGRVKVLGRMRYSSFHLPLPHFISGEDKEHFIAEVNGSDFVLDHNDVNKLVGKLVMIYDGYWPENYDCGFASELEPLLNKRNRSIGLMANFPGVVAPLIVPDSWSFQHFMDGALPKLVQSYPLILKLGAKLLIHEPRDRIIFEVLNRVGFKREDIILIPLGLPFRVEYMIYTCWTPPIHPVLWKASQRLIELRGNPQSNRDIE